MARKKRSSSVLSRVGHRLLGLIGIGNDLDLGGGVSVATLKEEKDRADKILERYNTLLGELDTVANELKAAEKNLRTLSSRALTLVRGKYGADSAEYERAGGVRASERKKPVRRAKAKPAPAEPTA